MPYLTEVNAYLEQGIMGSTIEAKVRERGYNGSSSAFRKLLKDKNVLGLTDWIEKAKKLEIREIDSFIHGIGRDLDAVKNAIRYEYNNGLAEGSVNKLKVIKQIMYGRCSFETLRIKTLRLEKMHKIN